MRSKDLYLLVPKKTYLMIILSRIYLSAFNVWVSVVIQETLNISLGMSSKGISYFKLLSFLLILSSFVYGLVFFYYKMKIEKVRITLSQNLGHKIMIKIVNNKHKINSKNIESGKLTNILTNDMSTVSNYLTNGIFPLIEISLTIIFGLVYLFIFSWQFALIYIIVGLIFYYINNKHNKKLVLHYGEYLIEDDQQKNFINEIFESSPIFSIYNLKKWMEKKYRIISEKRKNSYSNYADVLSSNRSLMIVLINFVQLIVLVFGFYLVNNKILLMGTMIGLWNAGAGSILFSFSDIPRIISYLSNHKASLDRVNKILESSDSDELKESKKVVQSGSNKICVDKVAFLYEGQKIFDDFTFDIEGQGITYVTGQSGSGKTTLFYLLSGELEPTSGTINYYRKDDDEQKDLFAFVPPNGGAFNISLYDNATLLSDKNTTEKDVVVLFKEIGLEKYINQMDKVVGKEIELSLGEIKRLSIVRALLSERDYLLLDEPFSDIDKNSQKKVMKLLRKYSNQKGVIVITHTYDFIQENEKVINLV